MAKARSENVAINTGASIAMKVVSQLMAFVLKTLFFYTLGEQYNGVSSLFGDILTVLSFAELGIGSAITFALYKPLKENDHRRIAALMNFYKKAYLMIAGFIVLTGLICTPFLHMMVKKVPDITENITLIFILVIIDTACSYLFVYKSTLLTAGQQRYVISKISIYFSFIRTGVQCLCLLIFKNYILFLVIGIVETLVRNYVVSRSADKRYPNVRDYPAERLEKHEIKKLFHDVYALSLYKINSVIMSSTDSIIIAAISDSGVVSVGYLSFFRNIIGTVDTFVHQFFASILPSLGNLAADSTPEKQYSIFKTLHFITFWFSCFCTTSLLVLTLPFIKIWLNKDLGMSIGILIAMLLDFYINGMIRPINTFRTSNGLFVQGKYRPVATAILDIAISVALAKPLGIFGVLIGTVSARLLTTFWFEPYLVYSNVFRVPVIEYVKSYSLYALITVFSCAVTYFLSIDVHFGQTYLDFLFKMALCVLIPNGLVILFYRKTEEFKQFVAHLSHVWNKARASIARRIGRNGASV